MASLIDLWLMLLRVDENWECFNTDYGFMLVHCDGIQLVGTQLKPLVQEARALYGIHIDNQENN